MYTVRLTTSEDDDDHMKVVDTQLSTIDEVNTFIQLMDLFQDSYYNPRCIGGTRIETHSICRILLSWAKTNKTSIDFFSKVLNIDIDKLNHHLSSTINSDELIKYLTAMNEVLTNALSKILGTSELEKFNSDSLNVRMVDRVQVLFDDNQVLDYKIICGNKKVELSDISQLVPNKTSTQTYFINWVSGNGREYNEFMDIEVSNGVVTKSDIIKAIECFDREVLKSKMQYWITIKSISKLN